MKHRNTDISELVAITCGKGVRNHLSVDIRHVRTRHCSSSQYGESMVDASFKEVCKHLSPSLHTSFHFSTFVFTSLHFCLLSLSLLYQDLMAHLGKSFANGQYLMAHLSIDCVSKVDRCVISSRLTPPSVAMQLRLKPRRRSHAIRCMGSDR